MTEWGVPSEKLREAMDSLDDAETAFSYMLPNVSCDDGVSNGALRWELVKLLELAASEPHLSGCSPSSTVVIIIMVSQDHHRHS